MKSTKRGGDIREGLHSSESVRGGGVRDDRIQKAGIRFGELSQHDLVQKTADEPEKKKEKKKRRREKRGWVRIHGLGLARGQGKSRPARTGRGLAITSRVRKKKCLNVVSPYKKVFSRV